MESKTKTHLSTEQVRKIILRHFPDEIIDEVSELTEGMQNAAWMISGTGVLQNKVVLKIGAAPDADLLTYEKDNLIAERHAYEQLKDKGVPIPKLLVYDDSGEIIANKYLIISYVEGNTWKNCLNDISPEQKKALMYELGKCAARIHSVEGEKFGYIKGVDSFLFDTWGEAFSAMVHAIMEDGRKREFPLPYDLISAALEKYVDILNEVKTPHLVDFDLWAGNIFINAPDNTHIAAVIDFGNCFYGDPFAEFVGATHLYEDVDNEEDLKRGYSEGTGCEFIVTEKDKLRMRLYRLYLTLIIYVESYRYAEGYGRRVREIMGEKIEEALEFLMNRANGSPE